MRDVDSSLLDSLLSNNTTVSMEAYVDFKDIDGEDSYDDLTNFLESVKISKKVEGNLGVNVTNNATLVFDNSNNQFSPKNLDSEYSGQVVPSKDVYIKGGIKDNTTFLFSGEIEDIQPDYGNAKVSFKVKDATTKLKSIQAPTKFYTNVYREDIIKELLDYAGVPYAEDTIDSTNGRVNVSTGNKTVWQTIQDIAKSVWGKVFVKDRQLHFKTDLSPNQKDNASPVKVIDNEDYFNIKEQYSSKELYNEVTVESSPLKPQSRQIVWRAGEASTEANEQYSADDISGGVLQLTESVNGNTQDTTNIPVVQGSMEVINRSTGKKYTEENGGITVSHSSGLISFANTDDYPTPSDGVTLDVNYKYSVGVLEPYQTKDFIINLDHPTTEIGNIHFIPENLTDDVKMIPDGASKEVTLKGNQTEHIYIEEEQTIELNIVCQDGQDKRYYTRHVSFDEGQLGKCRIETSVDVAKGWIYDDYKMTCKVFASNGDKLDDFWAEKTEADLESPTTITVDVSYEEYTYEEVLPESPDVSVTTSVSSNKQQVNVTLNNLSSKRVRLHGYLQDKDDTTEDMVLFGRPYTQDNTIKHTIANYNSIQAHGLNALGNIKNDYLLTQNSVQQLAEYLLYQYSTPMTILEVDCKPMIDLEVMDKIKVVQSDRDIDDEFFTKEIKYSYSANKGLTMKLKLRQAQISNFEYNDDGGVDVIDDGGYQDITKLPPVTDLDYEILKTSRRGSNQVQISWDYNEIFSAQAYNIYRKKGTENTFNYIGKVNQNTFEYIDSGVLYNREYTYGVKAVNESGYESDFGSYIAVEVSDSSKPTPVNLAEVYWGADYIEVTWEPHPDGNFEEYELRKDKNFGIETQEDY
jgi:hypothetical protein